MAGNQPRITRDNFNVGKNYQRLRIQAGAGVGDFDLNELQDILHFRTRQIVDLLYGRGRLFTRDGKDGFLIEEATAPANNFLIKAGTVLVAGHMVVNDTDIDYESDDNYLFEGILEDFDSTPSVKVRDTLKRWIAEHDLIGCRFKRIANSAIGTITAVTGLSELQLDVVPTGLTIGDQYKILPPVLTNPGGARADEVYVQMFYEDIGEGEDSDRVDPITGIETSHATKMRWTVRAAEGGTTPVDTEGVFGSIGVGVWSQKIADLARNAADILTAEITEVDSSLASEVLDLEIDASRTSENFPVQGTPKIYASLDARLEELADFIRADIAQLKGVADTGANWDGDISALLDLNRQAQRYRLNGTTIEMGVGLHFNPTGASGAGWYREDPAGGGIVIEARSASYRIQHAQTFDGNEQVQTWAEYQFDLGATKQITFPGPLRLGADSDTQELEVWNGSAYSSLLTQLANIIGGASPNWFDAVPNLGGGIDSLFGLNARISTVESGAIFSINILDPLEDTGTPGNPLLGLKFDSTLQVTGGELAVGSTVVRTNIPNTFAFTVQFNEDTVLAFNKSLFGKDSGGTNRNIAEITGSSTLTLGDIAIDLQLNALSTIQVNQGINISGGDFSIAAGTGLQSQVTTHKTSADHDGRYYTEVELDAGQLDNRYYTEVESDNNFAPIAKGVTNGDSHDHVGGDGALIGEAAVTGAVARWVAGDAVASTGSISASPPATIARTGNTSNPDGGPGDTFDTADTATFQVRRNAGGFYQIRPPTSGGSLIDLIEKFEITVYPTTGRMVTIEQAGSPAYWSIALIDSGGSPSDANFNFYVNKVDV